MGQPELRSPASCCCLFLLQLQTSGMRALSHRAHMLAQEERTHNTHTPFIGKRTRLDEAQCDWYRPEANLSAHVPCISLEHFPSVPLACPAVAHSPHTTCNCLSSACGTSFTAWTTHAYLRPPRTHSRHIFAPRTTWRLPTRIHIGSRCPTLPPPPPPTPLSRRHHSHKEANSTNNPSKHYPAPWKKACSSDSMLPQPLQSPLPPRPMHSPFSSPTPLPG